MFALKFVIKLVLIPVWLLLLLIWLPVHLAVGICGMFHGIGKLIFGALAAMATILGMWQNAASFAVVVFTTFLIVFAGTVVEVLLDEIRHQIGKLIVA